MPNRKDTINIINNALQSDNKKVIVLKGDWGIGKTYLWKEEIQPIALMLHAMIEIVEFYSDKLKKLI